MPAALPTSDIGSVVLNNTLVAGNTGPNFRPEALALVARSTDIR